MNTEQFINKCKFIHKNKYNYSKTRYIHCFKKVKIICPFHRTFYQRAWDHLNGHGCCKCSKTKKLNNKEFIRRSVVLHKNQYDYKKVVYLNSKDKVTIKCNHCNKNFKQSPREHMRGQGCPTCYTKKLKQCQPKTKEKFIEESISIHGKKYNYNFLVYKRNDIKVKIYCKKCKFIFYQKPNDHLTGYGCPKCPHRISKGESDFLSYMKIPNKKNNRQKLLCGFQVDGINGKKIYEFLGDYWHGNPNIFSPNKINKDTKKSFGELYRDTILKLEKLKSMGYNVKYIWENDWKKFQCGIDKKIKIQNI